MKTEALRSAFWLAVGGVSVRAKIMGLVAGPVLFLAVIVILHARSDDQRNFGAELKERGRAIGKK